MSGPKDGHRPGARDFALWDANVEREQRKARARGDDDKAAKLGELRAEMKGLDKEIADKDKELVSAKRWRALISTCFTVHNDPDRQKYAEHMAAKERLSPSDRLRIAIDFGKQIAEQISRDEVTDYQSFMRAIQPHIEEGSIAGIDNLFFKEKEVFESVVEPLHRAGMWARANFNELRLSDGLTAALLLTDVPALDAKELRLPFECFVMRIPPGLIPFFVPDSDRQEWCELLWVARYSNKFGTFVRLWAEWRGITIAREYAEDLSSVHETEDTTALADDETTFVACFRLVRNFILWIEDQGGMTKRRPETIPAKLQEKRKRSGESWPTGWVFGREVVIAPELRRAAVDGIFGRSRKQVDGWRVRARFVVRGHWRNQAHGPNRALRMRKWIAPFWKGPDEGEAFAHIYKDKR